MLLLGNAYPQSSALHALVVAAVWVVCCKWSDSGVVGHLEAGASGICVPKL